MHYNQKCSKCGQPATHKFTRIANGQVFDVFLCTEHAAEESPYQKQTNLSEILEGLLKQDLKIKITTHTGPELGAGARCQSCGLPFENYRKNFMLGCDQCYISFHDYLQLDLRKFHGAVRHVGRKPGGGLAEPMPEGEAAMTVPREEKFASPNKPLVEPQALRRRIDQLERQLQTAIASEDFEKAAYFRDQINDLKKQLHSSHDA